MAATMALIVMTLLQTIQLMHSVCVRRVINYVYKIVQRGMHLSLVILTTLVTLATVVYFYNMIFATTSSKDVETPEKLQCIDGVGKSPKDLITIVQQTDEPILVRVSANATHEPVTEKLKNIVHQSQQLAAHVIRQVRFYNESKQRELSEPELQQIYSQRLQRMKDNTHRRPKKKCYLAAEDVAPLLQREHLDSWIDPSHTYQLWHCQSHTVTPQHVDDLHVVALQLCGAKLWTIAAPKYYDSACPEKQRRKFFQVTNPKDQDAALRVCPSWARVRTLDVYVPAGYALVMPPNWLHRVETLDESLMLNLLFYKDAL